LSFFAFLRQFAHDSASRLLNGSKNHGTLENPPDFVRRKIDDEESTQEGDDNDKTKWMS